MLVTRRRGELWLITHPEHGRVAGELCAHWGNDRFQTPAQHAPLLLAATHHDDGWYELDGRPSFNAEEARPAHFLELPLEVTVGPYGRGVDSVYARDRHAGALVSMHWAGLYHTRFGLHGGTPVGHPLAVEVVAEQDHRRAAALREAWGGRGLRSEFEHQTWYAYELLQALDLMSLALGLVDPAEPATDHPVPVPSTLARIDQPQGARSIPAVPVAPGGPYVELTLRIPSPGVVSLDPYPFSQPSFELELSARRVEDRRYATAEDMARAYRDADPQALRIQIGPA
ncbi:MAG TPA: DUF3891 family protein [Solirubrobacteraceae bacterium]|nr:DUF3891 family protein [Solirubrobacteraceae bacterium]